MDFPKFWDPDKWQITKRSEDLWLELSSGEEKRIGTKTVYEKIVKKGELKETILEINIFNRGAVVHLWFLNIALKSEIVFSRVMKDGGWIYGPQNELVKITGLIKEKAVDKSKCFCGVRISLKTALNETVSVDILKDNKIDC